MLASTRHLIPVAALLAGLCLAAVPGGTQEQEAGRLLLVAGGGTGADGTPAAEARLVGPFGLEFDAAGELLICELSGQRVRRVDRRGILTTAAGTGEKGAAGDDGPALRAQFNGMHSLAIGPDGSVYLADTWNHRIRRLDPRSSTVHAFAGTGEKGFSGDGGPALQARFGGIYCVALDPRREYLYAADLDNRRIRKVHLKSGTVTTVAGNGERGVPADGAEAAASPLVDPRAVAVAPNGDVYVLERGGHALRVVDRSGRIRTVAGTGQRGFSGDGGPARDALLNGPKHLCLDRDGSVLIADTENHVIRRYLPKEGRIVRVAGCGRRGTAGIGGPPLEAELSQPHGVTLHRDGTLYIVDSGSHRVLKLRR